MDEALVASALGGSQEAYEQLYGIVYRRSLHYGFKFIPEHPAEREDFCHDATVQVLMSLNRFDGSSRFFTWATRIIMNYAFDLLRCKRASKRSVEMVSLEEARNCVDSVHGNCVETQIQASRDAAQVLNNIKDAGLLYEALVEGWTAAELANRHHTTVMAVKARIFRAKRESKNILQKGFAQTQVAA